MGETETPHFYDFKNSGRVPETQNHLFLYFETLGYSNKIKNIPWNSKQNMCINIRISQIRSVVNFRKDGRRKSRRPVKKQTLETLDMGSISINKHEMETW